MKIIERSGICHDDTGDCLITSLAFLAVLIAWLILLWWMVFG